MQHRDKHPEPGEVTRGRSGVPALQAPNGDPKGEDLWYYLGQKEAPPRALYAQTGQAAHREGRRPCGRLF